MTDISREQMIEAIRKRLEAATPGPWESDVTITEDGRGRYNSYSVFTAETRVVFDALNSDLACIHGEYDEDQHHHAWDEVARCNTQFAAHARTDIPWLLADNATLHTALTEATARVRVLEISLGTMKAQRDRAHSEALEVAAGIADRYGEGFVARDIRALIKMPSDTTGTGS